MRNRLDYRPEIDGLRAIAVFSVIFYHSSVLIFEKKFLSGGFIGVDIFFVISGYLISKLISNEYRNTKNFSFLKFYTRRIKRILPALLFVIIVSFPFIYFKTPPIFIEEFLKSIIFINLFISNIFFWNQGWGYDQLQNVQFQPFLHAWTLSLEEQFYLFFPIFFILIYKKLNKYLLILILIGFFLSLILSDYASYAHSSFNFYNLPTRAWEFLAGSIIFLLEPQKKFFNYTISSFFIYLGIIFIIISIFYLDDKMYLPSVLTLIPVLGTSFIIYFKHNENYLIKILQSKLSTGIGKISYSLYLWHFPVIILYPNLNFIFQITIILILSIFSYFFIEQKFRYKINSSFFSVKTIFITNFMIILFMFHSLNNVKNINYEKYPDIFHQILEKKINFNTQTEVNTNEIVFKNEKRNLHIVGDSHMGVLWRSLKDDVRVKSEFNLINQTKIPRGCYYVNDFYKIDFFSRKKKDICTIKDQKKRREEFISKKDTVVIIGGRLPIYLHSKPDLKFFRHLERKSEKFFKIVFENENGVKIEDGIKNSIYDLLDNGVKVILVYPVPILDFFPHKKIFELYIDDRENFYKNLRNNPFVISFSEFKKYAQESHNLLDSISHPNLIKIYTHDLFCDKISDLCKTHNEKEIFYMDDDHLSKFGNKKIVDEIFKKINKTN